MSLLITGGGAPASVSAHESEHPNPPVEGSSTRNNYHKAIVAASPSISISPFGQFDISPSSDAGVTLSHTFFDLHAGPTLSKDILGSSAEAHAGADVSGSAYVSVSPKDNVCVGMELKESIGASASATAAVGPASGTVGKDADKDIAGAHIQLCTGPGAGRALFSAADGLASGFADGLRAGADAVPAVIGFETRFRTALGGVIDGLGSAGTAATGGSAVERLVAPLLDLL
jgi:hypothetical protein